MGRPDGFLWSYPGIQAIAVPYFDTNDFFYSGHIGTCFLVVLEYRAAKWYKMSYITLFILINQWILMTFVRTHYIIDLITGLFMANYMFMNAEWVSFFLDVKFLGCSSNTRFFHYYKPCDYCGWSNLNPSDYMEE